MRGRGIEGVGLGWRPEIAADLLVDRGAVDFVEVIAEACFVPSAQRREAVALAEAWPVIPHGVKLSLGSAEGVDEDRARRLGALAVALRAPMITEHVALTSAGGCDIGHLTQLPRTREAVRVVARNVARARRHLPDVPLVLENVAWTLRWPDDAMREEDFYAEVAEATGCPMLLDLGNLYANALNEGRDPLAVLRGYPLDRVAMVHVAGGRREGDFYFDDHASPVCEGVFALLDALVRARGSVPVLLERDANFPPFAELSRELDRARRVLADGGDGARPAPKPPRVDHAEANPGALARAQAALARALTDRSAAPAKAPDGFADVEVARSREVLQRKRVDDALPLLARLSRHGATLVEAARRAVDGTPRPPRGAALSDAWSIAAEAARVPAMEADARVDLLVLRARFKVSARPGVAPVERTGPFVGSAAARAGGKVWAVKGLGARAPVKIFERLA